MPKRNRNRNVNRPGQQPNPPQSKPTVAQPLRSTDIQQVVDDRSKVALAQATESDIEKVSKVHIPPSLSSEDLKNLFQKMDEARQLFEVQQKRLEAETQKVIEQKKAYEEKLHKLEEDRAQFEEQQAGTTKKAEQIEAERKLIKERQAELGHLEADIQLREANAQAGFLKQYTEASEQAQAQIAGYQDMLARLSSELAESRGHALRQLQKDLDQMRLDSESYYLALRQKNEGELSEAQKRLDERQSELDQERKELDSETARLRREQKNLARDQEILRQDTEQLKETIEALVEKETMRVRDELKFYRESYQTAEGDRQRLIQVLTNWDRISKKVGKDSEAIPGYIAELEKTCEQLKAQLENAPAQQDLERLQVLDTQKEEWENERFRLGRELAEANRKLITARQQVVEHEDLRTEVLTLESSRKNLLQRNKELRDEVNARLEKDSDGEPVFPRCYDIDREFSTSTITNDLTDLKEQVIQIQSQIAREGLYYSDRDIRSLFAGLAMSRMVILQGISGTGKTSLPVHFAKAVGGECEVIEVQAGWRDRDDLLGHYNAFERKFYEKKFLQSLYKASRPTFSNRLFFILLDEMNLSYVEQYFADFLSVLERRTDEHWIDLLPRALPGRSSPTGFDNGRRIAIPPNVWFVGTANRDETTKDIADKTYDRSHVLELPVIPPKLVNLVQINSSPLTFSFSSIQAAFQKTQLNDAYKTEVKQAWDFLESLRPFLGKRMGAGWGSRLKEQASIYLPVLRACGGSWSDAVDDLLAMKILRKIRDRYEIQSSDLEELLEELEKCWYKTDEKNRGKTGIFDGLTRTVDLIDKEHVEKKRRQMEDIGT